MPDIFLDRDGVINYNRPDHVKRWEEFEFLPGSLKALARLNRAGYRVFVITNQAVINRKILSVKELDYIHHRMNTAIRKAGGKISAVLYCPHRPEEKCACRKPQPGLIYRAEREYGVQAAGSWLVGDHAHDIMAGEQAGCRTILVLSGRATLDNQVDRPGLAVTANLAAATDFIFSTDGRSYDAARFWNGSALRFSRQLFSGFARGASEA